MTQPSGGTTWSLPLVQTAHLPLRAPANVYATARVPNDAPPIAVAGAACRVLVASAHEVLALCTAGIGAGVNRDVPRLIPVALSQLPSGSSEILALDLFITPDHTAAHYARPPGGRIILLAAACLTQQHQAQQQATNKGQTARRFVLNIYGLTCPPGSDLASVSQDCVTLRLSFVPFVLTHSDLLSGRRHGRAVGMPDIILAGGDRSVHVYRFSADTGAYAELPFNPSHPLSLLHRTPSSVLSLDLACTAAVPSIDEPSRTLCAAGCQDGLVRVATLRTDGAFEPEDADAGSGSPWQLGEEEAAANEDNVDKWNDFYLDGPVSSAAFFSSSSDFLRDVFPSRTTRTAAAAATPDHALARMQRRAFDACTSSDAANDFVAATQDTRIRARPAAPDVRLLMANAVGFGAVYSSFDSSSRSFADSCYLNGLGCHSPAAFTHLVHPPTDSVLCTAAVDFDQDGRNELLLGTYAAQVLVFAEDADGDTPTHETAREATSKRASSLLAPRGYSLSSSLQFAHPVHGLSSVPSLRGDGVCDLVVTTLHSVDVLSWEVEAAVDQLTDKLALAEDIAHLEAALRTMHHQHQHQHQQAQPSTSIQPGGAEGAAHPI